MTTTVSMSVEEYNALIKENARLKEENMYFHENLRAMVDDGVEKEAGYLREENQRNRELLEAKRYRIKLLEQLIEQGTDAAILLNRANEAIEKHNDTCIFKCNRIKHDTEKAYKAAKDYMKSVNEYKYPHKPWSGSGILQQLG